MPPHASRLTPHGAHVVVGLSGGVDSSVSAYLLQQQGYRVSGLYMVNWTEDEEAHCSAAQDFQEARAVCQELNIPLHRVDFSREYRTRVFERFLTDYASGKTPNPDVLCNREVKFQPFREHALRLGADFVATGHYARLERTNDGPRLLRSADANKDQTYFLATVEPVSLDRVQFPVGHLAKPEVRKIAERAGLPNYRKRDSTGICFIGERPMRKFLARYLKPRPGPIVDDAGRTLGEHSGLMFYTLGQRRGLGIGGRRGAAEAPWFVVGKRAEGNALQVSQEAQHPALLCERLVTAPFHWIHKPDPLPAGLTARIRHRQTLQDCTIQTRPDGRVEFHFAQRQRAVAAGQFAVLYSGMECLGGGEIETVVT
ncbi:MAG: tRNA 2-thiouridine(34) synthase MnmA, partial [Nevskiales bacterium]|nr:tRNA 2-thiouridine(34) synthase MnmA [Nevskiales bacterium]